MAFLSSEGLQSPVRAKCLEKRHAELLECEYFHVVFTLPAELAALALQNKRQMYDLLFRATADTLQSIAADPERCVSIRMRHTS